MGGWGKLKATTGAFWQGCSFGWERCPWGRCPCLPASDPWGDGSTLLLSPGCSCPRGKPQSHRETLGTSPGSWWHRPRRGGDLKFSWVVAPVDEASATRRWSSHSAAVAWCRKTYSSILCFPTKLCSRLWSLSPPKTKTSGISDQCFWEAERGERRETMACCGDGDGVRCSVGRVKETYNAALSLYFVSLTIQYPAFPISWAPQVAVTFCRRWWGLPLSEKEVLFPVLFPCRCRKLVGIQFKKGGSKCHYRVLFLCWCKHVEMTCGFLCWRWGQLCVSLWRISFINAIHCWAYCLSVFSISFPSHTVF